MNKIVITLVAAGTMFIAGCSSSATPVPTVTVTQNAPAPEPLSTDDGVSNLSNEELYLLGLRSMGNRIINTASDGELLEVGYSVCDALDAGFSTDEIISYLAKEMVADGMTSDVYAEAVGYIIGAADSALCPGSSTF